MAKALVKYVECGWGHACTKEDYDTHVRNSPARAVANEPLGDEYYTFAIQQCGGSFAQWRAANKRNDRLTFVFDNASTKERYEIAKVFFAAANDKDRMEIAPKALRCDPTIVGTSRCATRLRRNRPPSI